MSQQRQISLADIERGQKLITNRTAIKILSILDRGEQLPGPVHADPQTLDDAVALLNQMGLVDPGHTPEDPSSYRTVTLTPRGRSVVHLLEGISCSAK